MPEKRRRQRALLAIVRERAVHSQEDLVALLRKRGIEATQASVSRDVRELGLVKVNGRYVPAARLGRSSGDGEIGPIGELVTGFEPIGANLIVVHTRVGAAGAVAVELDARLGGHIAGSIAGDDTIFLAVRSRAVQGRVVAELGRLAPRG